MEKMGTEGGSKMRNLRYPAALTAVMRRFSDPSICNEGLDRDNIEGRKGEEDAKGGRHSGVASYLAEKVSHHSMSRRGRLFALEKLRLKLRMIC
jgi:hypothetical protein